MSDLTRAEFCNALGGLARHTNAHDSINIFPSDRRIVRISALSKPMLIAGARNVYNTNATGLFIIRRDALADRPYIAQNWHTGEEHSFSSIGKLKVFLGAAGN